MKPATLTVDAWKALQNATPARIALGRAGGSLPTHHWLAFKASCAMARDAVHKGFDVHELDRAITSLGCETILLNTAVDNRQVYLKRPDLGRRLDAASEARLQTVTAASSLCDLCIIVSDGLSSLAAERQVPPLLARLLPRLDNNGWRLAPIVIVPYGRVALQDQIGELLGVSVALMLVGERPGLCSSDSLSAYLVHSPRQGNHDASRNCVSNIRPDGLSFDSAVDTILYLLTEMRRRGVSGIELKDQRSATERMERLELPATIAAASAKPQNHPPARLPM
jgi:ethanolamine ammonia-lyase small subunit